MAISPPLDIISEVAGAADPARYQAAAQRLSTGASPVDGASFADAFKAVSTRPAVGGADVYAMRTSLRTDAVMSAETRAEKTHQEFEAYILQTFVESMMPKDAENSFGKGTAGAVWKSMMAEQIGTQISKAGGIGLAKSLFATRKAGA